MRSTQLQCVGMEMGVIHVDWYKYDGNAVFSITGAPRQINYWDANCAIEINTNWNP